MPLRAVPCGHVPTTGFAGSTLEMKQRMRQSSVGWLLPKEALSTVFGTPRAGGSRMFRRRGKRASLTDRALAEADALVRAKKPIDAIRLLSNTNRTNATLGWSVVLSPFDWTAFRETSWSPSPAAWPEPVEDLFPGERIPEIGRSDLTADIVRSAIRNHGSLLVHGLVDSGQVDRLEDDIDRAFDGYDAYAGSEGNHGIDDRYVPLEMYGLDEARRAKKRRGGRVWRSSLPGPYSTSSRS